MDSLDRSLMYDLCETMSRRSIAVNPSIAVPALEQTGRCSQSLLSQAQTGRIRASWKVDEASNFWRPGRPVLLAEVPSRGFLGTTIGVYQPLPYLAAWLANHGPWKEAYKDGRDLFDVLGRDVKVGREEAKDVFYRFLQGVNPYPTEKVTWLNTLRSRVQSRVSRGHIETAFGTKIKVEEKSALGDYLRQTLTDALRVSVLDQFRVNGYVPRVILPDRIVLPHTIAVEYAKSMQKVSGFGFSVMLERCTETDEHLQDRWDVKGMQGDHP